MAEGLTGWAAACRGRSSPTPVAAGDRYANGTRLLPEGIDITTVSLTIQQLTDDNMEGGARGDGGRAARQLANFDVDVIYQSGVPPGRRARNAGGSPIKLQDRLEQASGLPCITDMVGVVDAMHDQQLRTVGHGHAISGS